MLALVAVLLIVLAPMVSRWIVHGAGPAHVEALSTVEHRHAAPQDHTKGHGLVDAASTKAGHSAHDHQAMAMPANSDDPVPPPPAHLPGKDPHAGHDMGVDCEYCLIAARMLSLLVALLVALIGLRPARYVRASTLPWRASIAPGHLGARGPPLPV
ncbi:DUF2946 domain-containing protein [Stenotrophomonas sp. C3(2023)]|nr:DUF2946 domain-containing protein [Stenotrophomonas sp. C3(2023)]